MKFCTDTYNWQSPTVKAKEEPLSMIILVCGVENTIKNKKCCVEKKCVEKFNNCE